MKSELEKLDAMTSFTMSKKKGMNMDICEYLRRKLPRGSRVYTLEINRKVFVFCIVNISGDTIINDITQSVASAIGVKTRKDGSVRVSGYGFSAATAVFERLVHALYPNEPHMENLRHKRL